MPDAVIAAGVMAAGAGPLSPAARAERRRRREWARPGSSHDRLIGILRIALPASVGVLAVALATAPLTSGRDISFVLSKDRVAIAKERMRITAALYRGEDSKGRPFAVAARSAVQQTSADPIVRLDQLTARITLPGGLATLVAPKGRYNMTNEKVSLDGPVAYRSADGYRLDTRDVQLDMEQRQLSGDQTVTGQMPLGTFRADRMRADLDQRTVVLDGHAHLHVTQRNGTAPR